jgi:hypothetical protein
MMIARTCMIALALAAAVTLGGCGHAPPPVPIPTFAPAVLAPTPTPTLIEAAPTTAAPTTAPAAKPTPKKVTSTTKKPAPKKVTPTTKKTAPKRAKPTPKCDLNAPVKIVGNTIVNRDCGYTDSNGNARSHDPWIDGQLQDEAARHQAEASWAATEGEAELRDCMKQTGKTRKQCLAWAQSGEVN